MSVNRKSAIRKTRVAQILGLGCVALAAGAVMFEPGLPKVAAPTGFPDLASPDDGQTAGSMYTLTSADLDPSMIGSSLNKAGGVTPAEVEKTQDEPPVDERRTTQQDNGSWKYLGGIFEPNFSFALVEIDGNQRMLRAGTRLDDLDAEVISVDRDAIEIERGGVTERIGLSSPSGGLVSVNETKEEGASVVPMGEDREFRDYRNTNDPDVVRLDAEKRQAEFQRRLDERRNRMRGNDQ